MTDNDIDRLALVLARHVDNLQRLADKWSDDFVERYDEQEAMVIALIGELYEQYNREGVLTSARIRALNGFRKRLEEIREQCFEDIEEDVEEDIEGLAENEGRFHASWILLLFILAYADKTEPKVSDLTQENVRRIRKYGVYNGETVKRIFQKIKELDIERIVGRVATGMGQRKPLDEILADVRTALETAKKQLRMNTAGIVNGVSNDVSAIIAERNKTLVDGVMWLTALDERVCEDCAENEGRVFVSGTEPACPVHVNCRCHLVPMTVDVAKELEEDRS